jgi:anti-anti-sigma factor
VSGTLGFRPVGEIDVAAVEPLRRQWYAEIDERLPDEVVIDLREVTFMDCSGLGLLAGVARRQLPRGGRVAVRHATPQVQEIMQLTGLDMSAQIPPGRSLIDADGSPRRTPAPTESPTTPPPSSVE